MGRTTDRNGMGARGATIVLGAALATLWLAAPMAQAGVISHWTFDTDFSDATGAHDAWAAAGTPTITPTDYQFGGGALSLDGSSYLTTGNWLLGGTHTVAAWVKPSSIATDWAGFFNKQLNAGQKVFWLGQHGTNGRVRYGNYYNSTSESALDAGYSLTNGQWTHVAGVWDEAATTQTLYVNGQVAAKIVRPAGTTQPAGNDELRIGRSSFQNFTGAMDEAWLYDQALTQQQVRNLMTNNSLSDGTGTGWVARTWDFESRDLSGWNVLTVATPGVDDVFATPGNQPAVRPHSGSYDPWTIQGDCWIRTWEGEVLGTGDGPIGIIETDPFVLGQDARFELLVGGGNYWNSNLDPDAPLTYAITAVTLERLVGPGDWDILFHATGRNVNFLSPVFWDASAYAGETVRLRIYDTATGSWGHIDVDNIVYYITPEPGTLSLLGIGAVALARRRRRARA